MNNIFYSRPAAEQTKAEKLRHVLSDRQWHSTRELSRAVGHCFAVVKYHIKYQLKKEGRVIEKRAHPRERYQYLYRLTDEP